MAAFKNRAICTTSPEGELTSDWENNGKRFPHRTPSGKGSCKYMNNINLQGPHSGKDELGNWEFPFSHSLLYKKGGDGNGKSEIKIRVQEGAANG